MTGLEELKTAYGILKDEYSYICTRIMPPNVECKGYGFVFMYQGFPKKIAVVYTLYDTPYPENDEIEFYSSDDQVTFSASAYFVITDLIKAFQNNRDNKDVMNEFINYLINAGLNTE